MMHYFLLALLLLPSQAPSSPAPVTVPFEIIASKHMAVNIKVNGKGPFLVIFDTGAPITLLSGKVGEAAGLIKKGSKPMFFGMQGFHKAKELELGELKAANIQVVVMDHPTVKAIAEVLDRPIEGIVGFPFFAKFKTAVNYQDKTLTMTPSTYEPGDVMASLMAGMMSGAKERKINLAPTTLWGLAVGKEASDEEDGVEVVHVFKGGVAEQAGLKIGDRILTLDHAWTDSLEDLYRAASLVKPGRKVQLKLRRDGAEKTVNITPPAGL